MEDGKVEISRVGGRVAYPAYFSTDCGRKPLPLWFLGHPIKDCKCTMRGDRGIKRRISGPILDRN